MAKAIPHGTKTGYTYGCRCVDCKAAAKAAARAYYLKNRDRILARNKAYYFANHEAQKAKSRERSQRRAPELKRSSVRAWRERNPDYSWRALNPDRDRENAKRYAQTEKHKAYQRRWRANNRDVVIQSQRDWMERNPEKVALNRQQTRFKRQQAERRLVTPKDWRRLVDRYGGRCAYCGSDAPVTQDHVIPLTRGGRHSIGNLIPACQSCNSSKNAQTVVEWRARSVRPK